MYHTQSYDVAVIGGGMVGLATAIGLAQQQFNVVVIDAGETAPVSGAPKLRVSAINHASQRLLENLGAWQYLQPERMGPYQKMQVWDKDSLGKIDFDANQIQQVQLGTIIENDAINHALAQRASELSNIRHIENQKLERLAIGEREAWLTLPDGDNLSAAVVVAADGAHSWVREQSKIPLTFWDYGHDAIVATVRTERGHAGTARQVFLKEGPLALLPMYESDLCSIVWSVPPEKAKRLLAADKQRFEQELTAALDARVGYCSLESDRQSFPLRMRYARHFARHRLLLAGDAAHTIHPLAGQGVNLGFLDAASIVQSLSDIKNDGKDIGEYRQLRPLERWRKAEALEMIASMEGVKRLFAGDNPLKKAIRDIGLNVVDNVAPVKSMLMQQAMGNSVTLPELCRSPAS